MKKSDSVHVIQIITKLELGGAQKVCLALMDGLEERGATLISGSEGVLVSQARKYKSVYLLDSFRREVGLRVIGKEVRAFFALVRILGTLKKKYGKCVVHTHSTKAGLLGRWAAWVARIPAKVHTVHGWGFNAYQSWPRWFIIYFLELITSPITTRYVCVSSHDVAEGKRLIPRFGARCTVIRAAVEAEKFIPAKRVVKKNIQEFVFGTVSCFKPQKNLFDLLRAFNRVFQNAYLNGRDVILKIIGDGQLRPEIETWIQEHDLEKNILLLGWQDDVSTHLHSWDAFVMSSLWEGLPCAVVEARMAHLPVISYSIGGIPDVIADQKNGFLVPPGDWEELSEKMGLIVEDGITFMAMKYNKDDLSSFRNSYMIKRHKKLYDELL